MASLRLQHPSTFSRFSSTTGSSQIPRKPHQVRLQNHGATVVAAAAAGPSTKSQEQKAPPSLDSAPTSEFSFDSTQSVMDAEAKFLVNTYDRSPVVFVKGKGCILYDIHGKEYLDMAAGIAVNALGHGDPLWVKAILEQATTLAHVSNAYYTIPQVKLAERLVRSSFADRVFFSNSGTEANEGAIKFSRKYQQAKNPNKGKPAPSDFIAFTNSFHGRTVGALSLTSKEKYRTPFEPLMPGVHFVEFGDLEAVKQIVQRGSIAAVFIEPVQGEGGVYPAVAHFLEGLRTLCTETNTLLVFDEVQCGLGRTGRLWAHEAYNVEPDIMTLAKPLAGGLPIGAVLVTEAVAETIGHGDHGSTFAGSPLVCCAALAVLDRLEEQGFLESVTSKGNYLRRLLTEKLSGFSQVDEVRGAGLLVGVQLNVSAGSVVAEARNQGLVVLTAGAGDVIRLAPPLIITQQEIEKGVEILARCLKAS